MANTPSPVSRLLLSCAFLAVGSAAGLQWIGLSAQTEAARQQASRQTLAEFSSILSRFETVPAKEKPAVAEHLTGLAERLAKEVRGESLASASRRVVALASYEDGKASRDTELRERLRAEVRGLVNEADSMESQALGRATLLSVINQCLLVGAVILCGLTVLRARRTSSTA
jgi:hypothetical protein